MKTCVVDASVIAAAFFGENYAAQAARLLASRNELCAPELIYAELASVAWKRTRRKEIDASEAAALFADMRALPLSITPVHHLIDSSLQLALTCDRSVHDCLYLALAVQKRAVMWTADEQLVNALAKTPLSKHVSWIGG